jgi:hypothetical protein
LVSEYPERDNPALPVAALAQVQPGGGIYEQMEHDLTV